MIFKTFKKLTRVPRPCIIVLAIVQDRERPCETVRDRTRPLETVRGLYTTAHEVHSTNELNRVNIVYKSYGMELNKSPWDRM